MSSSIPSATHRLAERIAHVTLLCLLVGLALLPVIHLPERSAHDLARVVEILLLLLAALGVLLCSWASTCEAMRPIHFLAALALTALVAVSVHGAAMPWIALREVLLLVGLVSLAALVASAVRKAGQVMVAVGIATGTGLYAMLVLGMAVAVLGTGTGADNRWLLIGFDNPRFFNHVQTVSIPLLGGVAAWRALRPHWRWVAGAALVVNFALLYLTLGRATMLGLLAAGALAVTVFATAGRRWLVVQLGAALLGLLLLLVVFHWIPAWQGVGTTDALHAYGNASGDHSRLYLWKLALSQAFSEPWLGIGPMHFAHSVNRAGAHPHNFYLQLLAELGLPAGLAIISLVIGGWGRAGLRLRQMESAVQLPPLAVAAWLACSAALVDAAWSGNLVMPMSQLWLAMAVGLVASSLHPSSPSSSSSRSSRMSLQVATLALLAGQAWLSVASLAEWRAQNEPTLTAVQAANAQSVRRPRFWSKGWF